MRSTVLPRALRRSVLAMLLPATLAAQQSSAPMLRAGAPPLGAADTYRARWSELRAIAPIDSGVDVAGLVLRRDAAEFTLARGRVYLTTPVGGRTVGLVFRGEGTFRFTAPPGAERTKLRRLLGADSLVEPITGLAMLFTDGTLAEVRAAGRVAPMRADGAGALRTLREELEEDDDHKGTDPDLMASLLNGSADGLFYARVERARGGPLTVVRDPYDTESMRLLRRGGGIGVKTLNETVAQFAPQPTAGVAGDRADPAAVSAYRIEATLTRTGTADLAFAAAATLQLEARGAAGPWIPFALYPKLRVDSARWADGTAAGVVKAEESGTLWLDTGAPLAAGASRTVTVYYHGDLIDRFADFFFIKSSSAWYPRALDGRHPATFDLTFHTPTPYLFASIGELVDSSTANRVVTTHWVSRGPMRNASFNLGLFKEFRPTVVGAPPTTVLYADRAHREWLGSGTSTEQVGADVANSMKFFASVFGTATAPKFYATEIPYGHGEAFPGLVHLSLETFTGTDRDGFDQFFRAHEVAHQWWGIGVDFATYHDQWLSEGMASFAGLWYLQTARNDNAKYFKMLDRWRDDIFRIRAKEKPIGLGYRVAERDDEGNDYNTIVYEKGAWVLHMLRLLMIDPKTMNEDRFKATMQDFYATYAGRRASTADFRAVVAKHIGADMGWFFDEWVDGAAIPTYRVSWKQQPADGGKVRVRLRVDQSDVPEGFLMYVPVTVDLGGDRLVRLRVKVTGARTELDLPLLPSAPKAVRFADMNGVLADVKTVGWSD